MEKPDIREELGKRILVLDGAMGTMIQGCGFSEADFRDAPLIAALEETATPELAGNNDLLCLTRPKSIQQIHADFLEAGADIITTNTFNAQSISQKDYGTESLVYQINYAAATLAQDVATKVTLQNPAKPRYVAGSLGPTNRSLSLSPNVDDPGFRAVSFSEMVASYQEQVAALLDGGVDLLLIETVFDTLNAKAALVAIEREFEERSFVERCGRTKDCHSAENQRRTPRHSRAEGGRTACPKVPIMISGTIADASGRTLAGQGVAAFVTSVLHANPLSVGFNCSLGAKEMVPHIKELARLAPCFVSAHPNAGMPNQFGLYDETPEEMLAFLRPLILGKQVHIIGGCCGTTPEHIRLIAEEVAHASTQEPRLSSSFQPTATPVEPQEPCTRLAGLDPLVIGAQSNFVNIGERCNVAGSRKFARLIREKKYDQALTIARKQVEGGAQIIDVNLDDAMLETKKEMVRFLNLLMAEPEIAKLPIMVDSSHFEVIEAGLQCLQGKGIVNSISLKEGEATFLAQGCTIQRYGAAVVVMAFDEEGQADTLERRIAICKRSYRLLTEDVGFAPADIIFDPNILTIGTGLPEHNSYGVDFIESVRWIKQHLPYAKTSGGVSNVSFAFRGNNMVREAIHSVFLFHAIGAGLDMGIVNPAMLHMYDDIPEDFRNLVEDLVLNRHPQATERLLEFCKELTQATASADSQSSANAKAAFHGATQAGRATSVHKTPKTPDWRTLSVEKRLIHAMVQGVVEYLEEDLTEAMNLYTPLLRIIEEPLMNGMKEVGLRFGKGTMFLPQVIKSARVMKKAVEFLQPHIEGALVASAEGVNSAESSSPDGEQGSAHTASLAVKQNRKKVLLATVKGDVHDIGKNIVSVVLGCNNYEVIDMGVMVSPEDIVTRAAAEQVDVIGVSGLITPSLSVMVQVAEELERRNLRIPLMIGGATTSKVHTAVKIGPCYSGPVLYVQDASQAVLVVSNLVAYDTEFLQAVQAEYAKLATLHAQRKPKKLLTLAGARANRLHLDWGVYTPQRPSQVGVTKLMNVPLARLKPYIDWSYFFFVWDLTGTFPAILEDPKQGEAAKKLYADATALLDEIIACKTIQANGAFGLWPAQSEGDDIILYADESCQKEVGRLYHMRQQEVQKAQEVGQSEAYDTGSSAKSEAPPSVKIDVPPSPESRMNTSTTVKAPNLSLSDFIPPKDSGKFDYCGAFVATAGVGVAEQATHYRTQGDDYQAIMLEALADRLAEAFAEYLHATIARDLSQDARHGDESKSLIGIRPAVGYPSIPEHKEKENIFQLLGAKDLGVSLTEHYAMYPNASVCGELFFHPEAKYFTLGEVLPDQQEDYLQRKKEIIQ